MKSEKKNLWDYVGGSWGAKTATDRIAKLVDMRKALLRSAAGLFEVMKGLESGDMYLRYSSIVTMERKDSVKKRLGSKRGEVSYDLKGYGGLLKGCGVIDSTDFSYECDEDDMGSGLNVELMLMILRHRYADMSSRVKEINGELRRMGMLLGEGMGEAKDSERRIMEDGGDDE